MLTNHARMALVAAVSVVVMIVTWSDISSTESERHSATSDSGILDIASKKLGLVLHDTAQANPLATEGQHSHHPPIVTLSSEKLMSGLNPKNVSVEVGSKQQSSGSTSDPPSSHRYAVGRLHISVKTSTASEPYLSRVGRVAGKFPSNNHNSLSVTVCGCIRGLFCLPFVVVTSLTSHTQNLTMVARNKEYSKRGTVGHWVPKPGSLPT